jgi:hypothetical protein
MLLAALASMLLMYIPHLTHRLLWALVALTLLGGCESKTRLFQSTYEKYYREQRRITKSPIIKLRDDDPSYLAYRHKIRPGDELEVTIMNLPTELKQGQNIVISEARLQTSAGNTFTGIVSHDGYFYIPLIPRLYVEGKVTDEVVNMVQQELSKLYDNPVATCMVTNLNLYLFGFGGALGGGVGGGGMGFSMENAANAIEIKTEKISLIEALAHARGISFVNKVKKVKIIRNYDSDNLQIIWLDLRDINVLKKNAINVYADDIIYAEARPVFQLFSLLSPYLQVVNLGISMTVLVLNIIL